MAKIGCNVFQVCAVLGITEPTLRARCKEDNGIGLREYFSEKHEFEKVAIKRALAEQMEKGCSKTILFLAKNKLGMSERVESKVDAKLETTEVGKMTDDQIRTQLLEYAREELAKEAEKAVH